jgi:hypothetical protein
VAPLRLIRTIPVLLSIGACAVDDGLLRGDGGTDVVSVVEDGRPSTESGIEDRVRSEDFPVSPEGGVPDAREGGGAADGDAQPVLTGPCQRQTAPPFGPFVPGDPLEMVYAMDATDMPPASTAMVGVTTVDLAAAAALTADAERLYLCHNLVAAITKAGKEATTLVPGAGCAFGIAESMGRVHYLGGATAEGGTVVRSVAVGGGEPATLATGNNMLTLAAQEGVVWWAERAGNSMLPRGPIHVANADGSGRRTIFEGEWGWPIRLVPAGDDYFFQFLGGAMGGPGVKSLGGGIRDVTYDSPGNNVGMAWDDQAFFLVQGSDLVRVSRAGDKTTLAYAGEAGFPLYGEPNTLFARGVAAAGDRVFLASNQNRGRGGAFLLSASKAGGSSSTVATCGRPIVDMLADASGLYLVTAYPTTIWRLPL